MASLILKQNKAIDLEKMYKQVVTYLPGYACPLFLRVQVSWMTTLCIQTSMLFEQRSLMKYQKMHVDISYDFILELVPYTVLMEFWGRSYIKKTMQFVDYFKIRGNVLISKKRYHIKGFVEIRTTENKRSGLLKCELFQLEKIH